jgi:hypothetical protein
MPRIYAKLHFSPSNSGPAPTSLQLREYRDVRSNSTQTTAVPLEVFVTHDECAMVPQNNPLAASLYDSAKEKQYSDY